MLQKQIIEALGKLGISVALPAFAGHVPTAFARIFPNASFETVQRWNRFPDAFCCPLFIDPIDPLFEQIGKMFLTEVIKTYGQTSHLYFSDPFNEVNPSQWTVDYLGNVSRRIYETMRSVDEHAVWLLQGWMFVNSASSWKNEYIEAFLTAVPTGRILVLDLQADKMPRYSRTASFYGQPFVWCMLHNFGGTLGMHGSFDGVNEVKYVEDVFNIFIYPLRKLSILNMIFLYRIVGSCYSTQISEFVNGRRWHYTGGYIPKLCDVRICSGASMESTSSQCVTVVGSICFGSIWHR